MTILIDDFFGRVSRALDRGPSGPEARSLQARVAQQEGCSDDASPSYASGFVSTFA